MMSDYMADDERTSSVKTPYREDDGIIENDEKVYVAVTKELNTCKSTLAWALQNSKGKKLCLVHVHQPAQYMSILGGRFALSSVAEEEVMAHLEKERQLMYKLLDVYLQLCTKAGVEAEKLYIETKSVEKGLLELITQNKIDRLVMGAAADNRYSRRMMEPKSKKANYVRQHAPDFCHIWFVCKGHLIYTREGTKLPPLNYKNEDTQSDLKHRLTQSTSGWFSALSRVNSEESFGDADQSSTFSLSHLSMFSRSSENATESIPLSSTEDCGLPFRSLSLPPRREEKQHNHPSSNMPQTSIKGSIHDQLDQAIADAKIAKQETFQESYKRYQAEKEATDAICKANAAENSYQAELRRRKEVEEELAKAKEELKKMKKQRDVALEELQLSLSQNSLLKSQSEKSDIMAKELEDKLRATLELLQSFRQP